MKVKKIKRISYFTVSILLISAFLCILNVCAWERGGKSLNTVNELDGIAFRNPEYNPQNTQFIGTQGTLGKTYIDHSEFNDGRYYKISSITGGSKDINPRIALYPQYLMYGGTYYDLKLTVTKIYSNKSTASFGLGRKPGICVNRKVGDWQPESGNIASIVVEQEITVSAGQENFLPVDKIKFYFGWSDLDGYECVEYQGNCDETMIFRPKGVNDSLCEYSTGNNAVCVCGMSESENKNTTASKKHTAYFKNAIMNVDLLKKSGKTKFRYGAAGKAAAYGSSMYFYVERIKNKVCYRADVGGKVTGITEEMVEITKVPLCNVENNPDERYEFAYWTVDKDCIAAGATNENEDFYEDMNEEEIISDENNELYDEEIDSDVDNGDIEEEKPIETEYGLLLKANTTKFKDEETIKKVQVFEDLIFTAHYYKKLKVMYESEKNGNITGLREEMIFEQQNPTGSDALANDGYCIKDWICDKTVSTDENTIEAGDALTMDQIRKVNVKDDVIFTARYIKKASVGDDTDELENRKEIKKTYPQTGDEKSAIPFICIAGVAVLLIIAVKKLANK